MTGFMKRHPNLSWRTPQQLGYQRLLIQPSDIKAWFGDLQLFLIEEVPEFDKLVNDPARLYNMDESGFPLSVKSLKALAQVGTKNVYHATTETHANITVLACCSADGSFTPPVIVFKGERRRNSGMEGFPEAIYVSSQKWVDRQGHLSELSGRFSGQNTS